MVYTDVHRISLCQIVVTHNLSGSNLYGNHVSPCANMRMRHISADMANWQQIAWLGQTCHFGFDHRTSQKKFVCVT